MLVTHRPPGLQPSAYPAVESQSSVLIACGKGSLGSPIGALSSSGFLSSIIGTTCIKLTRESQPGPTSLLTSQHPIISQTAEATSVTFQASSLLFTPPPPWFSSTTYLLPQHQSGPINTRGFLPTLLVLHRLSQSQTASFNCFSSTASCHPAWVQMPQAAPDFLTCDAVPRISLYMLFLLPVLLPT